MSELLARLAARANDSHACIVDARGSSSYADVARGAHAIASALTGSADLSRDITGERVAIFVPPGAAFVSSLYGAFFAGASAIVLSPLHPTPETRYFCDDAGVKRVLVAHEHADLARPLASASRELVAIESLLEGESSAGPETIAGWLQARAAKTPLPAPALQLYTSGTTGKPKGAVLTHENLSVQQGLVGAAWGFGERDVLLHALPLHHMHGLAIAMLTALGAGATTRTMKFDAEAIWSAMADATVFMGVPAMYHRLFVAFDAASAESRTRWTANARGLRLATSGSAALPVGIAERWKALTGTIPLERFGMTEIGVGISNVLEGERFAGCVGFPLPTVETRIVAEDGSEVAEGDAGELLIRGPSVFAGYHGREEATANAFAPGSWFRTGDTVARQRDLPGAPFKILGRTSVDILKSGGYKLSALEIEDVLREHPGVLEIAVVGVPDEAWGDRVVACVVSRQSPSADGPRCDADDLRTFARARLAPYKVPKDFVFLRELPKNALGKVLKPELMRSLAPSVTSA